MLRVKPVKIARWRLLGMTAVLIIALAAFSISCGDESDYDDELSTTGTTSQTKTINSYGLSLVAGRNNLLGLNSYGDQTSVTAYVKDEYGSPVGGVPVRMLSEAGTLGQSSIITNSSGVASTTLDTSPPAPWDTASVDPYDSNNHPYGEYWMADYTLPPSPAPGLSVRDQYDTQHGGTSAKPSNGACNLPNPRDGNVTLVAVVQGQEQYLDSNNNGTYDTGEYVFDIGEPYVDANDNATYDLGEIFIDYNGDGTWTGPNGQWDEETLIWTSADITFSAVMDPQGYAWKNQGSQACATSASSVDFGTAGNTCSNASAATSSGDACWVKNFDLVPRGGWSIDDGGSQGFTAYLCDFNHNPVSTGSFTVELSDNLTTTAELKTGDRSFKQGCDHNFVVSDANPGDTAGPASAYVCIKSGGGESVCSTGTAD